MNDARKFAIDQLVHISPGPIDGIRVFFAPGRVNLIGEHTDYNGGYVFPAALSYGTWLAVRPRRDGILTFASTSFSARVKCDVNDLHNVPEHDFANYPKGVIRELQAKEVRIEGADFLFHGTIPNGAGLSSSASVELATATAINALSDGNLSPIDLVKLCQKAENEFVGVNCGIMDQFAVGMGARDQAILLNCDTLDYRLVPLVTAGHQLVITNTNKRRGLADSKYNERRAECDEVQSRLVKAGYQIGCLADVAPESLDEVQRIVNDDTLYRRARHVITENARVHLAAAAVEQGDLHEFGRLMTASHASLRDDYEVTGNELDTLVEEALSVEGCLGSRMTGAGFGGCTVSLVAADRVHAFQTHVEEAYEARTGLRPTFYPTEIGDGAREILAD